MEHGATSCARLLNAPDGGHSSREVIPGRVGEQYAEGRGERGAARLGSQRPHHVLPLLGSALGPAPLSYDVALTIHTHTGSDRGEAQVRRVLACCPDFVVACVGGGSNAIGCFHIRSSPTAAVALVAASSLRAAGRERQARRLVSEARTASSAVLRGLE